jgi:hypothetical protein
MRRKGKEKEESIGLWACLSKLRPYCGSSLVGGGANKRGDKSCAKEKTN